MSFCLLKFHIFFYLKPNAKSSLHFYTKRVFTYNIESSYESSPNVNSSLQPSYLTWYIAVIYTEYCHLWPRCWCDVNKETINQSINQPITYPTPAKIYIGTAKIAVSAHSTVGSRTDDTYRLCKTNSIEDGRSALPSNRQRYVIYENGVI